MSRVKGRHLSPGSAFSRRTPHTRTRGVPRHRAASVPRRHAGTGATLTAALLSLGVAVPAGLWSTANAVPPPSAGVAAAQAAPALVRPSTLVKRLSLTSGPQEGGQVLIVNGKNLATAVDDSTPDPSASASSSVSASPSDSASASPSASASESPSASASESPSATGSASPSDAPSESASASASPTGAGSSTGWVAKTVSFGTVTVPAEDVVALSSRALKIVTPAYPNAMVKTKVPVLVTVGDATKGPKYTYVATPVTVEVDEDCTATSEDVTDGGVANTPVTLTGTHLSTSFTKLLLGGKAVKTITIAADGSSLTFTPPKKVAGIQDLVVSDKRAGALYAGYCTYSGIRPTITGLSSTRAITEAPTTLTLTGTNLTRVSTAYFGTEKGTYKASTATSATVKIPKGVARTAAITLETRYEMTAETSEQVVRSASVAPTITGFGARTPSTVLSTVDLSGTHLTGLRRAAITSVLDGKVWYASGIVVTSDDSALMKFGGLPNNADYTMTVTNWAGTSSAHPFTLGDPSLVTPSASASASASVSASASASASPSVSATPSPSPINGSAVYGFEVGTQGWTIGQGSVTQVDTDYTEGSHALEVVTTAGAVNAASPVFGATNWTSTPVVGVDVMNRNDADMDVNLVFKDATHSWCVGPVQVVPAHTRATVSADLVALGSGCITSGAVTQMFVVFSNAGTYVIDNVRAEAS